MNDRNSKLYRIFMSIDNLESMCKERSKQLKLAIAYQATQFNKDVNTDKTLDKSNARKDLAIAQLSVINQYLLDFQAILKRIQD